MIAALVLDKLGAYRVGSVPATRTGAGTLSEALPIIRARGLNLVITLMVCITAFHAGNGGYGVMPPAEYDGDPATSIHEFDPFPP